MKLDAEDIESKSKLNIESMTIAPIIPRHIPYPSDDTHHLIPPQYRRPFVAFLPPHLRNPHHPVSGLFFPVVHELSGINSLTDLGGLRCHLRCRQIALLIDV